jgi:hypothetical protein
MASASPAGQPCNIFFFERPF